MGEATETIKPRIYVACLAAYNSGYLHGSWIDADQSEEVIRTKIDLMLKRSPIGGAEEFAIHDYEGFEGARIEEYSSIATVVRIAEFLTQHGALGGKVLEHFSGDIDEAGNALEDRYCGQFQSLADYMQDLTEESIEIPEALRYYIDWHAMARDAEMSGDLFTIQTSFDELHVFSGR